MSATHWFVPELHDVAAGDRAGLDAMLALLDDRSRATAAVLVVPDWRGGAPIDEDAAFGEAVRALSGTKVLHGLTHHLGERAWDRLWYGTPNEGEFARLSQREAADRLRVAARRFEAALGERPRWFCAPRWQQSAGTTRALGELGIAGIMRRDGCALPDGGAARVPALWFDDGERAWTRAAARVARSRRVASLLATHHPFRLALHPRDARHAATRREIAALLARLREEGWEPRPLDALAAARDAAVA